MGTKVGDETPPKSTDLAGWREAIAAGRLKSFRLEALAAAFQDLGHRDTQVRNALAKHLSDSVLGLLRRRVSFSKPNQGQDIILRVQGEVFSALLQPQSADGRALRKAFGPRVEFRLKDALAAEDRERGMPTARKEKKAPPAEGEGDAEEPGIDIDGAREPADSDDVSEPTCRADRLSPQEDVVDDLPSDEMEKMFDEINVEQILDSVTDYRKRLAFRLYMEDVPFKTTKENTVSIASVLDVSEKTARDWVTEVRQLLGQHQGVKRLQQPRVGVRS